MRAMLLVLAVFTIAVAAPELHAAQPAPGAGPIMAQITPCLIANRSRNSTTRCPEPPLSTEQQPVRRAAAHLQRALYFIDMLGLTQALAEADAALALTPNDADARHLAARLAYTEGPAGRADTEIAIAQRLAPDNLDIRASAASFMESRAPSQAIYEFNAIIKDFPIHVFARAQRGRLLLEQGRAGEALHDFDFVLSGDNPATEYLMLRAEAYRAIGNPRAAIPDYSREIELHPTSYRPRVERAAAYAEAGDDAAALRDYDEVLGSVGGKLRTAIAGDGYGKLLSARASVLVRMTRFDDAVADMIEAVKSGGKPSILRTQIFLRRNGFPDVKLDGRDTGVTREALRSCFGLAACFQKIMQAI